MHDIDRRPIELEDLDTLKAELQELRKAPLCAAGRVEGTSSLWSACRHEQLPASG